ncbi:LLM class flavin-dependent oxidoreductase [Candidatus Bathyarchaeota archaeon]|nr:LLM class flavin-dependent oxidoreductase [Candidatus Bathyarchaeota archaeon]
MFNVFIPTFAGRGGYHTEAPNVDKIDVKQVVRYAKECERLGYDSVLICDHFMYGKDDEILESWVTMSTIASLTKRVKVGSWVFCNSYRHPAIAAKMAATLDVFSGGRLIFGYGAGWFKREYDAFGIPFKSPRIRIEEMDEGLQVIKMLWTLDEVTFKGRYYRLEGAKCLPKPLQKPHPPIMVGAQKPFAIKIAAKHADIWDTAGVMPFEQLRHKTSLFKRYCKEFKRNIESVRISWSGHALVRSNHDEIHSFLKELDPGREWEYTSKIPAYLRRSEVKYTMVGTAEECVERIRKTATLGFNSFTLVFIDFPELDSLELFAGEVIPKFK